MIDDSTDPVCRLTKLSLWCRRQSFQCRKDRSPNLQPVHNFELRLSSDVTCEVMLRVQAHRICSMLLVIAASLFAGSIVAQESTPKPLKYEEFVGEANVEDIKVRLDLFSIELTKYPNAEAHVIIYRTRTQPAAVAQRHLLSVRDYLVNRGVDPRKLVTVDGGMTTVRDGGTNMIFSSAQVVGEPSRLDLVQRLHLAGTADDAHALAVIG